MPKFVIKYKYYILGVLLFVALFSPLTRSTNSGGLASTNANSNEVEASLRGDYEQWRQQKVQSESMLQILDELDSKSKKIVQQQASIDAEERNLAQTVQEVQNLKAKYQSENQKLRQENKK